MVQLLLEYKANVHKKNSSGHGPLACTVKRYCSSIDEEKKRLKMVDILLQCFSIKTSEIKEALKQSTTKGFKLVLITANVPEKEQINAKMLQNLQKTFALLAVIAQFWLL